MFFALFSCCLDVCRTRSTRFESCELRVGCGFWRMMRIMVTINMEGMGEGRRKEEGRREVGKERKEGRKECKGRNDIDHHGQTQTKPKSKNQIQPLLCARAREE